MRRGERRVAGGSGSGSPLLEGRRSTESEVYDDGTNTFFWRAHTLTVLFILTCALGYVTLLEETPQDTAYNTKRGIVASILVFLCFGVTQAKDGPFSRPHPAYWRFWLCVSVVYELFLIFILFQTVQDGRQFLKYVDPRLGVPLPERDYGGNCLIYDADNKTDPFHNIWDKLDGFVPAHFIGWYLKTLMIRDWWMCMIISVMFEFLEYSLEHQLPNFSECWWDHWIMDVLICNGLGIYCGMKTLEWLSLKTYKWQGLWNIPTYKYILGVVEGAIELWTPKHQALLLRRVASKMGLCPPDIRVVESTVTPPSGPLACVSQEAMNLYNPPLIQPELASNLAVLSRVTLAPTSQLLGALVCIPIPGFSAT